MEFDKSERITALTLRLVKKLAGDNQPESHINQLFHISVRIMGSTISAGTTLDDFHVSEMIKRKLMKDGNTQGALQFADLSRRLISKRTLEQPWRLLYLLCKISEGNPQASANWIPTSLPAIGDGSLLKRTPQTSRISTASPDLNPPSVFLNSNTNLNGTLNNTNNTTPNLLGYSYNYNYGTQITNKFQSLGINENTSFEVPEGALIRDIVYAFQAIDGKYIKYDTKLDMFAVDPSVGVSKPVRDQIVRMCELGWLFRRVKLYLQENSAKTSLGLIHQSLCAALSQELADYYRFIAVLDGQINQQSAPPVSLPSSRPLLASTSPTLQPVSPSNSASSSTPFDVSSSRPLSTPSGTGAGSLTLRRLEVWIFGPMQKMKLMAIIVDGLKGLRGGAIISFVETYTLNGDPAVRAFVKHLMEQMCVPLYKMVKHWVFEGELEDPFSEFFVASDPSVPLERVWHSKYTLRKEMVPSIFPLALANKILLIGKSINFIRQCCKDTTWVTDTRTFSEDTKALSYGNTELFEGLIKGASVRSSKRLIEIMLEKFQFITHCTAIKRYLLLGQGDFTQHLMDRIGEELLQPAVQLYRHNLMGLLQTAIEKSNAQYDEEEVLKRLDIKLLEPPPGGTGWDIFSLDYHVDTPINAVFTNEIMGSYLHIFQFLWNIKRVEYALSATWRRQITASHRLEAGNELLFELHKCNIIRNEMLHFVYNLQYYIMFEVLESSWSDFIRRVKEAQDLDELIAAHGTYLAQIINNTFLSQETQALRTLLQKIFWVIIRFSRVIESVYTAVDEEAELQQSKSATIAKKTASGKWGVTKTHAEQEAERIASQRRQFSPELRAQVFNLTNEYHTLFATFMESLSTIRLTGDVNLKFLAFRLDFNEFYQTSKRLSQSSGSNNASASSAAISSGSGASANTRKR